jgi:hypothetical protein
MAQKTSSFLAPEQLELQELAVWRIINPQLHIIFEFH